MAWLAKGYGSPPLSILRSFYKQKMYVGFERIQVVTILQQVAVAT